MPSLSLVALIALGAPSESTFDGLRGEPQERVGFDAKFGEICVSLCDPLNV